VTALIDGKEGVIAMRLRPVVLMATTVALCLIHAGGPARAQDVYQTFRTVYGDPDSTNAQLRELLPAMKAAFDQDTGSYKLAFGIGAIYDTLGELESAETWYVRADNNARSVIDRDRVAVALGEVRAEMRKVQRASAPPIFTERMSFSLKRDSYRGPSAGHVENVPPLPNALPRIPLGADPAPLLSALEADTDGAQVEPHGEFIVVSLTRRKSAAAHYDGFKDFHAHLRRVLFPKPPATPIVAVLGDNSRSLVEMVRRLYPTASVSADLPFFGLYNANDNILFATVTGGYGTMLHELGHALVKANYPHAPFWLEEGVSMLYERSAWQSGRPEPLENWRMGLTSERGLRDIGIFSRDAGAGGARGLTSAQTNEVRMLALYLYRDGSLRDILALGEAHPDVTPMNVIEHRGITAAQWDAFVTTAYGDYRADLNATTPSYKSEKVEFMQKALNATMNAGLKVDGQWGRNTEDAVRQFQQRYGLEADGVPGARTMKVLKRRFALSSGSS
jgi:peptidoglycan hydrolase-like protein with peptidoglycan-binding domain